MNDRPRLVLSGAVAGGAVLVGDQLTQLGAALLRSGPSDAVWRFQFATLVVGRAVPLVLAVVLVAWVGWAAGAWGVVRGAAWAGWGVAGLLGAAAVVLWADGPAARAVLLADQLSPFTVHWIRVLGVGAAGTVAMVVVGASLRRASRNTTP